MQTFSHQTTVIPLSFPLSWDPSDLSSVTLQIADVDGNELQAATGVSLYTATTLAEDVHVYEDSITLADDAEGLSIGDHIRITGIYGYEDHVVKGFDTETKLVTLERATEIDFEEGAFVYRLSAIATVDFSNTDTYPSGIQLVLTWTPTGTGSPITEQAEVEGFAQVDVAGLAADLQVMFPRAYEALKSPADRLDRMVRICTEEIRDALAIRGCDIARIKDQRRLTPLISAAVAYHWSLNGDVALQDERETLGQYYSATLENFAKLPLWVDLDGDGKQEEGETQDYPLFFERNW